MAERTKTAATSRNMRVFIRCHIDRHLLKEKEDFDLPVVLSFSGHWRGFRFLSGIVAAVW